MRISDWSSDVCSSDLLIIAAREAHRDGFGERNIENAFSEPKIVVADARLNITFQLVRWLRGRQVEGAARGIASEQCALRAKIGRAHVCTPATNAHLVCRLLLDKKMTH